VQCANMRLQTELTSVTIRIGVIASFLKIMQPYHILSYYVEGNFDKLGSKLLFCILCCKLAD